MTEQRILLVEDESTARKLLTDMLSSLGYAVTAAADGREALERYREYPYLVVVTDLEMPVMDGSRLIEYINELEQDTVIIVQTAHDDLGTVIEIMKRGVFDYIVKPVKKGDMQIKVKRAFEIGELKRTKRMLEHERLISCQTKLDWLTWNESLIKRDYNRIDRALFKSLHTNFNQGAGFGTLLTLIKLIAASAREDEGKYVIDAQIFKTMNESAVLAERALNTFSEINEIIASKPSFETITVGALHGFLAQIVEEMSRYTRIKGQKLLLSDRKPHFDDISIRSDNDFLGRAIRELLLNAMKFSKKNSSVILILDTEDSETVISIINDPIQNDRGIVGIPMEYANLVFEPFFRLDSHVFEDFDSLDYGLGLTKVEKILDKMEARISFSNVTDLSDLTREPVTKVNFMVRLPVQKP